MTWVLLKWQEYKQLCPKKLSCLHDVVLANSCSNPHQKIMALLHGKNALVTYAFFAISLAFLQKIVLRANAEESE